MRNLMTIHDFAKGEVEHFPVAVLLLIHFGDSESIGNGVSAYHCFESDQTPHNCGIAKELNGLIM